MPTWDTQWTLENGGVEKSFADWGLTNLKLSLASQAVDACTFDGPGTAFDAEPLFVPFSACVVRSGRTGSGTSYAGGTQRFVGLLAKQPRVASGRDESGSYEITGLNYYFENLTYKQFIRSYVAPSGTFCDTFPPYTCGVSPSGYSMVSDGTSEWELIPMTAVVLNQDPNGGRITVAAQVAALLQFVVDAGAPFQFDAAEITDQFGALELPTVEQPNMTCAAALAQELAWVPDCESYTDYSTGPPTFHIKRRGNLAAAEVDLAAGDAVERLEVADRQDLRRSQVVLWYRRPYALDGFTWVENRKDAHPPGPPADPFNILEQSVDLYGFTGSTQVATLVTQDIPGDLRVPEGGPAALAWWKRHAPWLANMASIEKIEQPTRKVVDGGDVTSTNGTLPRKLENGVGVEFMVFAFVEEEFSGLASYTLANTSAALRSVKQEEPVTFRIRTTNGSTGDYSSVAVSQMAEDFPDGLAEQIWTALDQPQFEGGFSVVAEEATGDYALGKKVSFTNGQTAWATMGMPVKAVVYEADEGRTTVRFGPNRYLGSGELVELLRVARLRKVTGLTTSRATGRPGGGADTSSGQDAPKENTSGGPGRYQTFVVAPKEADVAAHGHAKIETAAYPGTPTGNAALKFTTLGTEVKLRETLVCDAAGVQKYCMVLRSPAYTPRKTTGDMT